jgi:hypothetical protein
MGFKALKYASDLRDRTLAGTWAVSALPSSLDCLNPRAISLPLSKGFRKGKSFSEGQSALPKKRSELIVLAAW